METQVRPPLGLSLAALVVLCVALLLPGCRREEPAPASPSQKIGQGLTLSYWAPIWIEGLRSSEPLGAGLYEELEKATGVHIELVRPQSTSYLTELRELQSSGSMPDILEWSWLRSYPGGPAAAIDDGLIVSLGDDIRRHAPNLLKVLLENPEVVREVTAADGRYYAFPDLSIQPSLRARSGPVFRKDWLEKTNMKAPETIDDWHKVLRAFRATSFGTPGGEDEYPFCFRAVVPWLRDDLVLPNLTASNALAGAYGVSHGLYRSGGKIAYGPAQPAYRQVLELIASWYKEGLIHPGSLDPAMGRQWIQVLGKSGATIASVEDFTTLSALKFVPVPLPRGGASVPSGTEYLGPSIEGIYAGRRAAAVSAASKHRAEAVRWLDVAYGSWGQRLFNFGVEGKTYRLERGAPVLTDSVVKDLSRAGITSNLGPVLSSLYGFSRGILGGPFLLSEEVYRQEIEALMPGTSAGFLGWGEGAFVDPATALVGDPESQAEVERSLAPIRDHVNRALLEFVSGRRSLDDFDVFVRELEELGLTKVLATVERADGARRAKPVSVR